MTEEPLAELRRRQTNLKEQLVNLEKRRQAISYEMALIEIRIKEHSEYKPPVYHPGPFGNPIGMPRDKEAMRQYKRTICTIDLDGLDLEL